MSPSRRAQRRDGTRARTDYLDRYALEQWTRDFELWLVARIRPAEPPAHPDTRHGTTRPIFPTTEGEQS